MVRNILNKRISGFSMLEASVVMLIVGIFVALCANAYTKRHITYQESDGHGRYECYRNGGNIVQRYVENNSPREIAGTTCVFRPPRYAKYFLINVSGGGTAASAGKFDSLFFTSFADPITITPGAAGGSTTLKVNERTIHSTSGGGGEVVVTSATAETVNSCELSEETESCGSTTSCTQDGSNILVNYCFDDVTLYTQTIPLADIKKYRQSSSGDTLIYKDLSSYTDRGYTAEDAAKLLKTCSGDSCLPVKYKMTLKFQMQNAQDSQMESYLSALGITDGIADAHPGAKGQGGAVLILW